MKSLATRLSFRFAGVFATLLFGVVLITSLIFAASASKTARDAVATAGAEAKTLDGIAAASHRPLIAEAASIVQVVGAHGVRVAVYDLAGNRIAGDPSLPPLALASTSGAGAATPVPSNYSVVRLSNGIVALAPAENIGAGIAGYWVLMIILGGLALIIAWLVGRNLATQSLRPVADVTMALSKLAEGDFSRRNFIMEERSEVGSLSSAYNAAADKVASAFAAQNATEARMRQFIADAGHELRTPLTVMMGYVDVLRRGAIHEEPVALKILETMGDEGGRMRSLIDELLMLARLDDVEAAQNRVIDIAGVVSDVVESIRRTAPARVVAWTAAPGIEAFGDEVELRAAIANLVDNALKYAPDSNVDVSVVQGDEIVAITVSDSGPGMTAQECAHAFDRFYRGENRGATAGVGLGLAIVKRSVERSGGSVELDSTPGAGTRVTIRLRNAAGHKET